MPSRCSKFARSRPAGPAPMMPYSQEVQRNWRAYMEYGNGTIGDFVWFDQDGDSFQDSFEPGIANVQLTLTLDLNGDGTPDYTKSASFGSFDLKPRGGGEFIGLAVMTELPLVIVNSQRGGPSTGLPTKTEQSDLLQAVYGRNGEAPVAVIAACTPAAQSQERARVASQLRAEGDEEGARIRADSDRQRTVILSEAYRDAERIRGAGDARAAEIYAEAYSKDRDFYSFYRSMQAYRQAIGRDQDILVLQPESDFFKFLQNKLGTPAK